MKRLISGRLATLKAVFVAPVLLALGLLFATMDVAAQAALPVTGVDVGDYVTLAITAVGTVVATIVGGYFAFLLIKKLMAWGRKAFG